MTGDGHHVQSAGAIVCGGTVAVVLLEDTIELLVAAEAGGEGKREEFALCGRRGVQQSVETLQSGAIAEIDERYAGLALEEFAQAGAAESGLAREIGEVGGLRRGAQEPCGLQYRGMQVGAEHGVSGILKSGPTVEQGGGQGGVEMDDIVLPCGKILKLPVEFTPGRIGQLAAEIAGRGGGF